MMRSKVCSCEELLEAGGVGSAARFCGKKWGIDRENFCGAAGKSAVVSWAGRLGTVGEVPLLKAG